MAVALYARASPPGKRKPISLSRTSSNRCAGVTTVRRCVRVNLPKFSINFDSSRFLILLSWHRRLRAMKPVFARRGSPNEPVTSVR